MEDQPLSQNRPGDVPPDAVRSGLEHVVASRAFRLAQGQSKFLRYVVEETLAGRGDLLKEYMIGVEAFARGEAFDPRLDPIVRTQARKLRARLDKYYADDGAGDTICIEFHKGSYTPGFRWKQTVGTATPDVEAPATPDAVEGPAEMSAAAESLALPVRTPPVIPVKRRPRVIWLAAVIAMVAIACVSYLLGAGWRPPVARTGPVAVAVLPFVNLNGNADEFLADGMSAEVIRVLKHTQGLQVVSRMSAFRFKGKTADIRDIARQLHVEAVLTGSVKHQGDRLRVTAQLDSAPGGYQLWMGTFETMEQDAPSLPGKIASAAENALGPLGAADRSREIARGASNKRTPNAGAYQAYLKGLYFWNKLSGEGLTQAIDLFQQAISDDPSFARAYAALANCYVMAPQVIAAPTPESLRIIRASATRALELDGSLGEAHFDLAVAAEYDFDWKLAEAEFRKGLELDPGSAVGHLWYAKLLALTGRKDEVFLQRKMAADLDPVSPYAVQGLAGYYSVVGRYEEAVVQFKSALALDPNFGLAHQGLGFAYYLQGKHEQAISELQTANQWMAGAGRMALLGYVYARTGHTQEARNILNEFLKQEQSGRFPAFPIGLLYLGLGDKDEAFRWLNKAVDQRDLDMTLQWDTPFDSLRGDPRYTALLQRMKLA